jgi:uncharacterized protein
MRRADREISGIGQIEEIINKSDVCRIAFANNNYPYMVTMNFGYTNDPGRSFYFHCAKEGKKLEMMRINNHVCFELDTDHKIFKGKRGCDWGMTFSSVLGYGNISEVTDNKERIKGLNSIMSHYGGEGVYEFDDRVLDNTIILRLDIVEMTGKKK